ncbi:glycosyltransferase family 2 protein [Roseateles sp. NT4]|uniref:glycosyltransferase family 2 protein n=1 Tax=Roseateles sp. NT4 TaxID=3453715 RepID=UPI003EEFAFC9
MSEVGKVLANSCSIVIASYNRAELLDETLVSLHGHLNCHGLLNEIQVVLIDNNSPDRTPEVMSKWQSKFPFCAHARELNQGLSYARNAGLALATGEVVVFLDDDVEVHERWLPELIQPFSNQNVAVVGGKVLAFGSAELPDWLPREYGYLVSVFDPFDTARATDKVMGANFALRASSVRTVGTFDPALGRKGAKLLGGEEVDLFDRIRRAGGEVWYTPAAVVYHKIANKLRKEYIIDYAYWLGVSEAHMEKNSRTWLKYCLKYVRSIVFPIITKQPSEQVTDDANAMRLSIKRQYARGYLAMAKELAS